jgi:hypothetical protein
VEEEEEEEYVEEEDDDDEEEEEEEEEEVGVVVMVGVVAAEEEARARAAISSITWQHVHSSRAVESTKKALPTRRGGPCSVRAPTATTARCQAGTASGGPRAASR